MNGTRYLCGFTFGGRHSFAPFAETIQQVERDLAAGATYLEGDVWANVVDATSYYPQAQGAVFFSPDDLDSWAAPINEVEREVDWCLRDDSETWLRVARVEHVADGLAYRDGLRRAPITSPQRMHAFRRLSAASGCLASPRPGELRDPVRVSPSSEGCWGTVGHLRRLQRRSSPDSARQGSGSGLACNAPSLCSIAAVSPGRAAPVRRLDAGKSVSVSSNSAGIERSWSSAIAALTEK